MRLGEIGTVTRRAVGSEGCGGVAAAKAGCSGRWLLKSETTVPRCASSVDGRRHSTIPAHQRVGAGRDYRPRGIILEEPRQQEVQRGDGLGGVDSAAAAVDGDDQRQQPAESGPSKSWGSKHIIPHIVCNTGYPNSTLFSRAPVFLPGRSGDLSFGGKVSGRHGLDLSFEVPSYHCQIINATT